jgi:YggT family protein
VAIICTILDLYVLLLLVRIVLSWFPVDPATPFGRVVEVLDLIIRPLLDPIRRTLPPVRLGDMGLDLSPIVLLLGVRVVAAIIGC